MFPYRCHTLTIKPTYPQRMFLVIHTLVYVQYVRSKFDVFALATSIPGDLWLRGKNLILT